MLPTVFGSLAWMVFTASIPLLINRFHMKDKDQDRVVALNEMEGDYGLPINESYDFIVVGAGTAGCILARRLSKNHTVLLLEAGGEPPPIETITTLVDITSTLPDITWFFGIHKRENETYQGGVRAMTAGKMMGGSGSINNLQHERGSPYDYERWANVTGDNSWRYENVLNYFKRIENYKGEFNNVSDVHGHEGNMDVVSAEVPFREDLFFSAGTELGYEVRLDPNGPQKIGFSPAEYNRDAGHRVSTYTNYLQPVQTERKNLTIRKYSVATQIVIDGLRATGVQYERHGIPRVAYASKEIILSAGAFMSPMILMASGIGPKDQLDLLKVDQVVELPVGHNLQTHPQVDLLISFVDRSVFKYTHDKVSFNDFEEFKTNGTGILTARDSYHEAFLASSRAATLDGNSEWPDIQLRFRQRFRSGKDFLVCQVALGRPRSMGRILVNEAGPALDEMIKPVVDYNLFSDETDYDVVVEGIKSCHQIVNTKTFKEVGASFVDMAVTECKDFAEGSREYWKCFLHYRAYPNPHNSGTCRMGSKEDSTAVVDTKLRVRGVNGLRVIDASVMPFITNANINAVVMMIAEKTADDVLQTWSK